MEHSRTFERAGSTLAMSPLTQETRSLGWAVGSPIPAVMLGLAVMALVGVPSVAWLQNAVATALGLVLVTPLYLRNAKGRPRRSRPPEILVAPCLAVLALCLLQPGTEGVRRWLPAGLLNVHAGALLLPLLLVLAGQLELRWSAAVALSAALVTFLQPDAAQAAGLALGWTVLATRQHGRAAVAPSLLVTLVATATVFRFDPLDPIPHVEGVVGLAGGMGPFWTAFSLVALALPPLTLFRIRRASALAVGAYLVAVLIAAWLGHYPVPFMGYGVAPILGYYLAIVALGFFPEADSAARTSALQTQ